MQLPAGDYIFTYTAVDDCGNETQATRLVQSKPLYGAKWDRQTNLLTRTRSAAGITTDTTNFVHMGSINANYDNPFDSLYPWSDMKVVNVDLAKYRLFSHASIKECVIAEYGDPNFTYEGSDTVFVGRYRPEFWYTSEEDEDGNVEFLVSPYAVAGYSHAAECVDGISFAIDDGSGNNTVTSGAGVPLTNVAVSTIHTRAQNSGFYLQTIYTMDAQICLYLVEYANMNIQQALGNGCSDCYRQNANDTVQSVSFGADTTTITVDDSALSSAIYAGTQVSFGPGVGTTTYRAIVKSFTVSGTVYTIVLDRLLPSLAVGMYMSIHGFASCEFPYIGQSIGNASGYLGTNSKANAWYRGALMYANRYSYITGIYRETGTNHIWLEDESSWIPSNALNTFVHIDTGIALPTLTAASWQTVGGNAQKLAGLSAFMATGTSSGSQTSPVGDQQYVPSTTQGNTILLFGGLSDTGWSCGAFCGSWSNTASYSIWNRAALPILR